MSCCSAQIDAAPIETSRSIARRLDDERVKAASQHVDGARYQTDFIVPDMHCVACISTIERGLKSMQQVCTVRANLTHRTVTVIWDETKGSGAEIAAFLKRLGFEANIHFAGQEETQSADPKGARLLKSLAVAGFAAANIMLLSVSVWSGADAETAKLFHLISGLIAIPAVAYAGRPFFESALKALTAGRLNMDVPISLAVLLATVMSVYESFASGAEAYFDAAVTLLFFLLIGRYLDHLMRQRARGAVDRLARLGSKGGVRIEADGSPRYIALADIKPGMHLRVSPGERMPVDGVVLSGSSDIDRALVTGESAAVSCAQGDRLEAGVLVLTGTIEVTATGDAKSSFLAEISKMISAAERGRSHYVGIADRLARIYAPAVHLLALITFLAWMVVTGGDWHASIYTAIAVLIITCPCALGLAVPVVQVIGANRLMQRGIMMRDGTALERLAEIDTVFFDKTGTLTLGEPSVAHADAVAGKTASIIKAMAASSTHPSSRALDAHLLETKPALLENLRELPGLGIEALHKGETVRLGNRKWVSEIALGADQQDDGAGVAFARRGGKLSAFQLQDRLRPMAEETVRQLKAAGLRIEILSGDHAQAVKAIADQLNIADAHGRMTPQDKIAHIQAAQAAGSKVLMVGDGLNDAPSLAAAHASVTPASASDVGRLASDLVFIRPELTAVPFARRIALRTGQLVRQNFALALLYNCFAIPLAMAGLITPLIAAIAMSTSSIVVIANSLRLNLMERDRVLETKAADTPTRAATSNNVTQMPARRERQAAA